jgi:hypothetical protein
MLIVPPPLIECLRCFDGRQTDLDLRALLVRITGDIQVGEIEQHLIDALSSAGFLEDEVFARMKAAASGNSQRRPGASGARRFRIPSGNRGPCARPWRAIWTAPRAAAPSTGASCGIAAPHVSPEGGWQSYRAAYQALGPELKDRTFVILATSHYGEPEHFGPHAQTVRDAVWRKRHRTRPWSIGWRPAADQPSSWKTTAIPSSTPSSFRCSSCNISTGRTSAFFRFFAGSSPTACIGGGAPEG